MKTKVMLIVLFLLASTCAITTVAEEITASLIHRFDAVLMRRDVAEMLALLVELDSSEAWSFGAGIGPTDADFLQTQIVQVLYDRFLDENNRIKGDDLNGNGAAEKGGGGLWAGIIQTAPRERKEMLRLLSDKKPAVRWIGLKKTTLIKDLDSDMIEALRTIMSKDPYMRIVRKAVERGGDRPLPPGLTVNEISFPLREMACRILNTRGHVCELDEKMLAREGVIGMAKMWEENPHRRVAVQDAISLLNPHGLGVLAIKEFGGETNRSPAIAVFVRKVKGL